MYQPSKKNKKANTLTRIDNNIKAQKELKKEAQEQVALLSTILDKQVKADLRIAEIDSLTLVDTILQYNYIEESLRELREQVKKVNKDTKSLKDKLLLYKGRLIILESELNSILLQTTLIKEAYTQVSIAYLRQRKTTTILSSHYYQKGLRYNVNRYIYNYRVYKRLYILYNKTLRLLQLLLILNQLQ